MRKLIFVGVGMYFVWLLVLLTAFALTHRHRCIAPCTVHFSKPMAEDSFKIDYRGNGTLRVTKKEGVK